MFYLVNMNNKSKKYIYVFGSYRKFLKFKEYFNELEYFISGESSADNNIAKTRDQLLAEFNSYYSKFQTIEAMISFGKGSLVGSIEAIAQAFEDIKNEYPNCANMQFIGPSAKAALTFCNKFLTHKALSNLNIPVADTIELFGEYEQEILNNIPKNIKFPIVLKAENLSGGRGSKYVANLSSLKEAILHFYHLGIRKFILNEYISGVEATFTVLRLENTFLRLPASYKKETTPEMKHPDEKVKISGIFKEFDEYFEYVEKVMKEYSIYGFFSLQGVLVKKDDKYSIVFLEAAPRMTGSTPIMEASLIDFDIFATISKWIIERKIEFAYTKRLALQYASYIHNGEKTVKKLMEKQWIVEAKYEDLSVMPYSEDNKNRIRISFYVDNQDELQEKLNTISSICGNVDYTKNVNDVISWFYEHHKNLTIPTDKKVLEGVWDENTKWEFYLSSTLPDIKLCSAVFGLPKIRENILLTKTHRGWELPGGHIEDKEKITDALKREVSEEVGMTVDRCLIYGYRKIISSKALYNRKQEPYPYPISYIPHFLVASDSELKKPDGEEVIDSGSFALGSPEVKNSHVKDIISIGTKELGRIS